MKTKLLLLLLFLTAFANAQITNGLLHEFRFNNSLNNVVGNAIFTSSGTTFVADRTGSASSAVQITNATINASLAGLPTGAAARTISYWYKTNGNAGFPITFSYGINTPNRMFGMYLGVTGNPTFYCNTGDVGSSGTYAANTWRHIVITYNGSQVITYLDGIVIINSAIALNTGLSNLSLGHATNAVVTIDDLQIFNRALLASEVQVLFGGAFPDAIAEYDFNNSYNNKLGVAPFTNVVANAFVTDRNGISNSALFVNNAGITATIPGIPYGTNLQVSVSVWVKFIGPLSTYIYSYGTWPNTNAPFVTNTAILATGPGGNHTVNTTNVASAWTHFVFVYDGTNSIIYKNGVSLSSLARNWNFINDNDLFKIGLRPDTGASQMNAEIDDLKIYNYALDQTRITNLFTNNSLTVGTSITNVSATGVNTTSATINYSLNANNTATTSVVKYGLTSSNLTSTATGFAVSGNTTTSGTASLTGLLPITQYFYRVEATNSAGTSVGLILNFTTPNIPASPAITAVSASGGPSSALISYTLNANNAATTSIVKYGLTSGNLSSQIVGSSTTGSTASAGTAIITGLLPTTQYFYQIEAVNSVGSVQSAVGNFTTLAVIPAIAEYDFNNTRNNINGTQPFNTLNTTFVADRNGNASSALRLSARGTSTTITGLPIGSSPRSVSIWYKVSTANSDNCLFVYGQSGGNNAYGVSFNNVNTWFNFAWNTNTPITNPSNDGQWHHLVTSFDSSQNSRVYVDGVLKNTLLQTSWNTANIATFWLGGLFDTTVATFDGTVDDLKIYNYALSQTEVTILFTDNTLSSPDFNQNNLEVALYPNPANDVLNIETTSDLKLIEIYNIQGQKILSATQKQINVSELASGIYMIKIQNAENAVAIKKIIIK